MAAEVGAAESRSLEQTPTWAVAIVCLAFVLVSIIMERAIHLLAQWLRKTDKKTLGEALERFKSELMLLGFVSLLLTIGRRPISKICISKSLGDSFLPCSKKDASEDHVRKNFGLHDGNTKFSSVGHHRKLMFGGDATFSSNFVKALPWRRILAAAAASANESGYCAEQGKVPLISQEGLDQLHIFVFLLAVCHVLSCIITLALGQAKMYQWQAWEQETRTMEYELSNDPARFRFIRETTFGRRHMSFWSRTPILVWIVCFFRQFVMSVPKVDYLKLRHGFILAHFDPENKFDFQEYIQRSLYDDFKVIVSISPPLWFLGVLFLLLHRDGWFTFVWLSFLPLLMLLILGSKLQVVVTKMALEIQDRNPVIHGAPVVKPSDKLFWFNRPRWILHLIHFTLFQNAFQFAFFFWAWYEYGLKSCFQESKEELIGRLSMGIGVQILCSYVTLPLYALVTQMGTKMKPSVFDERVANSLKRWHQNAKKNLKRKMKSGNPVPSAFTNKQTQSSSPSGGLSPVHLLQECKTAGELQSSSRFFQSEYELSDSGTDTSSPSCSSHFVYSLKNNGEAQQNREVTKRLSSEEIHTSLSEFSFAPQDNGVPTLKRKSYEKEMR